MVATSTGAIQPVAGNIGRHRRRRGLSLSALAAAAGISKSTLSELERGRGNPSLDTLWALAKGLNVPLSALFMEPGHSGVHVLPLCEAEVFATGSGMLTQHLLSLHGRGELEVYVVTLAAGANRTSEAHTSGQFEHVIGISGRADVGPDGESTVLEEGDLISFPCDVPHHYTPLDGPARFIVLHDYP